MFVAALVILGIALCVILLLSSKTEQRLGSSSNATFRKLQKNFFLVYFLAAVADWLQGPYIYKLYSSYGFSKEDIALLYIVGFASSLTVGSAVGSLADRLGRKKLCIVYCVLNSVSCLTKVSTYYGILLLGRILGGISTSILFSVFEAWYVYQHTEHFNLPQEWINLTLAKSTFYNGLLAILAGVVSNFTVVGLDFGPVSPFLLAIPCLLLSAFFAVTRWSETNITSKGSYMRVCTKTFSVIFSFEDSSLILLGVIQSLYESVMYVFVFLWTPVLESISPPHGIVFSCFMVCIMIGSTLYSFLIYWNYNPKAILASGMALAGISFFMCSVALKMFSEWYAEACFVAFLVYEVSVGLYFPAIGYLRSRIVPEEFRAAITNWFRLPMNLMTCVTLLWLNASKQHEQSDINSSTHINTVTTAKNNVININHIHAVTFALCSLVLIVASVLSSCFLKYSEKGQNTVKLDPC